MSVLTLVRHGQASFFAERYDQLTPLGEQQARSLGEFWARGRFRFDEVYTGPKVRQRRTAELAGEAFLRSGLPWPEPIVLDELDEYDLRGLLHRLSPDLARQSPEFAALADDYGRSEADHERLRTFQAMFEALLHHWQSKASFDLEIEAWPAFRKRVDGVLRRIRERPGPGRRIAVFTSGGFIGTAVQSVLAAPDRAALELNWRVRNGSLTEFVFSGDRFTLDGFNALPHLPDPSMWTYR